MKPYQERVVKEEQDLAKKCEALVDFTESNPDFKTLTLMERKRLNMQLQYMLGYLWVLRDRIRHFVIEE